MQATGAGEICARVMGIGIVKTVSMLKLLHNAAYPVRSAPWTKYELD